MTPLAVVQVTIGCSVTKGMTISVVDRGMTSFLGVKVTILCLVATVMTLSMVVLVTTIFRVVLEMTCSMDRQVTIPSMGVMATTGSMVMLATTSYRVVLAAIASLEVVVATRSPGELLGGGGSDRFVFGPGSGLDTIRDFQPGQDKIVLTQSLLPGSSLGLGALSAVNFQTVNQISGSTATAKIIYDRTSGIVYYNPTSGSDVPLIQLNSGLRLSASSFEISNG
jgi:hypothetical protein